MNRATFITLLSRAYDPAAPRANTTPPNESSFAALGINVDADNFGPKNYNTVTKNGMPITYSATVSDYRVFEEDDAFPKQEGREYRIMTIDLQRISESDGSGTSHTTLNLDCNNVKLLKASMRKDETGLYTYTILLNGKLADFTIWTRSESIPNGLRITWTASVPKGYDGVVVGMMNSSISASGKFFNEFYTTPADFALFRMK